MLYSAGQVGTCRAVGRPSGHAGPSAGRQGTVRGFLWDNSHAKFGVGDSCHVVGRSGIFSRSEMTLPETEWCGFRPKLAGRVRGRGQSECPIQVMTLRFGVAPPPRKSYKGRSGPSAFLSLSPHPRRHRHNPPPAAWTPPYLHPHDVDPTRLPGPAYHSIHALWTLPLLHSSPSFMNTVSTRAAEAR